MHSQTLLSRLPQIQISVDYQILARMKVDWTCQIFNLSYLLPTHFLLLIIDISTLGVLSFIAFLLYHQSNSTTSVFTFSNLSTFSPLFGDSLEPSDSISLHSFMFVHSNFVFFVVSLLHFIFNFIKFIN